MVKVIAVHPWSYHFCAWDLANLPKTRKAKYQIDLKSLDEQLQRHLSRAWTMEKDNSNNNNSNKQGEREAERGRVPIRQD
ncbi:hypothetical protein LguiA_004789 [Lonicera macranthoides]